MDCENARAQSNAYEGRSRKDGSKTETLTGKEQVPRGAAHGRRRIVERNGCQSSRCVQDQDALEAKNPGFTNHFSGAFE
jgi:hypothetical protein